MHKRIYLDNAATTKIAPEVFEAMEPYLREEYGNASGIYGLGANAAKAVFEARKTIAAFLGAETNEIYFTGGGSESDNWALQGIALANREKGRHIITTKIEHHAVLHTCAFLEKQGFEVTYLDVDEAGTLHPKSVEKAIRPDTILVSAMAANNEIGTIEPLQEIGRIAKERGILFHTDAVQAYGHIKTDVKELNVDLLSASAHKCYGPKGVGILYVRNGVGIEPLIHGGAQERAKRAGTLNTPGIVGFGRATELAQECMDAWGRRESVLRDRLINRVLSEIPDSSLNGDRENRLPGNVSFCFDHVEGEALLICLDQEGICASGGSACTAGSEEPSHVLLATGVSPERAKGSLRLTLSAENTEEEIDFTVEKLKKIICRLRSVAGI